MSEKLLDILKPQGDCIPEELLIRYAEGKLSAAEARRLEEHVSECEFCSDALDGIMQGGNSQHFHSNISSIRKIVHKKMRGAESSATFPITRTLAIAATLMLLAISVWYVQYVMNERSQEVFSNQFKPYPAPAEDKSVVLKPSVDESKLDTQAVKKSTPIKYNPGHIERVSKPEKELEPLPNDNSLTQTEDVEEPAPSATYDLDDVVKTDQGATKKQLSDSVVTFSSTNAASNNGYYSSPTQQKDLELSTPRAGNSFEEVTVTSDKKKNSSHDEAVQNFQKAMEFYKADRYAEAISEFQLVLNQEPTNQGANFYSGVSALALKNSDEALKYFKRTDCKTCQYYEASLWYEALSYLNKEDKKQAKKLLEKVVELNGEYKVKAEESLKQL